MREHLFSHLTSLSLRYFSQQRAGWIIARLTSDIDALSDVLNEGLATLVANGLTLVAAIIGLYVLDWRLALAACAVVPPALLLTRWFQVKSQIAFADVRNRIAAVTAHIAESVAGMAVVQAYNREQEFQRAFDVLNGENRRANVVAQRLNSVFFPGIEFLGVIATGIALSLGSRLHDEGSLTVGTLIAFVGPALARLPAAAGALRAVRPGAVGGRRDEQDLDRPRHRDRDRLAPGRPRGAAARGHARRRPRDVRLRQEARAVRRRPARAGRRLHRARRRVGRREVDAREADRPLLRPRRGSNPR